MQKIYITDGQETAKIFSTKGLVDDDNPEMWSPSSSRVDINEALLVPSVQAALAARMNAMGDLPFAIYNVVSGDEVDNSDGYKNACGLLKNPAHFFSACEGSLVTSGAAYWYKILGRSSGRVRDLRYWLTQNVVLDAAAARNGEALFHREGQRYTPDDVFYVWLPDINVEFGGAQIYPLKSALTAAAANGAITDWVQTYMQRGAVKAMMLLVEGAPVKTEVERLESWFNRFMTGARALRWKVFSGERVKPTVIGEGLEALSNLTINSELRVEIHTAMGTRHLLEDENYATAKTRYRQFYETTVVPNARIIQNAFNTQILAPLNLRLEFQPQRLEAYQDDEAEQANSFAILFDTLSRGLPFETAFELACRKLDYQFSDSDFELIKTGAEQFRAERARGGTVEDDDDIGADEIRAIVELDKWRVKTERAGKSITFHPVHIPPSIAREVQAGRMSFDDARAALRSGNNAAVLALADAINKAAGSAD